MSTPITVVLQGPISWDLVKPVGLPTTLWSIRECRRLLPGCEVIVSTWEREVVDFLEADQIVFSIDPGMQPSRVAHGIGNNVNRQIVSTCAGLRSATHSRVLKLRSDAIITSANFIKIFEALPAPSAKFRVFERKIISNNLSSRNPRALPEMPLPFHPSDHAHFGLKSDLLTLWDLPLQDTDNANYFLSHPRPNHFRDFETSRLTPEQYLCTQAFSKHYTVSIEHYADTKAINLSENLMLSNFEFLPDNKFSIYLAKYHTPYHAQFEWMRYPVNHKGKLLGRKLHAVKNIIRQNSRYLLKLCDRATRDFTTMPS